jgi:hypothetical protein
VRCTGIEQAAQVAPQQLPGEEVRLVAVIAVDHEAADAARLQDSLEGVEVLHVLEQVLSLFLGQRFVRPTVVVGQFGGRIRRVAREGVWGRVVSHVSTLSGTRRQ